jgi:hypothetical protein
MKKLVVLFLFITQFVLANESIDAIFKKANDSYKKANYEEALIGFEKIAKGGSVSADLYFNIGNTIELELTSTALIFPFHCFT